MVFGQKVMFCDNKAGAIVSTRNWLPEILSSKLVELWVWSWRRTYYKQTTNLHLQHNQLVTDVPPPAVPNDDPHTTSQQTDHGNNGSGGCVYETREHKECIPCHQNTRVSGPPRGARSPSKDLAKVLLGSWARHVHEVRRRHDVVWNRREAESLNEMEVITPIARWLGRRQKLVNVVWRSRGTTIL